MSSLYVCYVVMSNLLYINRTFLPYPAHFFALRASKCFETRRAENRLPGGFLSFDTELLE